MIVPGILVCRSVLIIVSKALLISSATVIVRAGGAIWLNPFAMVLFNVCRVVCFVPVLRGCVWYLYLYDVTLFMSLLGCGMGTLLANFHMCCSMLVLRAFFNMLVRNSSPRWHMCFRCLMFSL